MPQRLAYFISPHGFGHAARAAAIMAELQQIRPEIGLDLFTTVPQWFFQASLTGTFAYHPVVTDIGLVQQDALHEDLDATIRRLDEFLPFSSALVQDLAGQVRKAGCDWIVCDIAPLGIAVAQAAGLPSVLVENFTWDWIYEGYAEQEPRLEVHRAFLRQVFEAATFHIQTEPVCSPHRANLLTNPVSRGVRTGRGNIRAQLDIPAHAPVVLITMGGMEGRYTFFDRLRAQPDFYFIVPGSSLVIEREAHLVRLPRYSQYYHPDLINASDAVIGKVGYSTVAEVYQAGAPFGYVPREKFRESPVLAHFANSRMEALEIEAARFEDGTWLSTLPALLTLPRIVRNEPNGAVQVARWLCEKMK